jgi:hypothetical protein
MPTDDIAEAQKAIDTVLTQRQAMYPHRVGTKRLAYISKALAKSATPSAKLLKEFARSCERMAAQMEDRPGGVRAKLKGAVDALVRAADDERNGGATLTLKRRVALDEK